MTAVWEEGTGEGGVWAGQLVQWEGSSKVLRAAHFCFRKNHNQIVCRIIWECHLAPNKC